MAAAAVLVAALWSFVNMALLCKLLAVAMGGKRQKRQPVLALATVKFPVLYLTGFFILQTRRFPVSGILAGLTVFLFGFGLAWALTRPQAAKAAW
jgi:hypothetical protein